ncbi:MAG: NAD(P)H-dependent oxidoreductase [Gemmatimonadaceae bacterium]|nr:NAD(P)H-dependent oxidoreductase [Gemmatimonadaceae bacterium]
MKATILLGTLKKAGTSNTEALSEFLANVMQSRDVDVEIIRLVDHNILPGTESNMGAGDDWPMILEKILASQILILATPVWWGNQSSLIQRVIERMDALHDRILKKKEVVLDGKVGGIIVTGDSDGAEQIIGNLCNFFNAIGLLIPPFATLTVLWERQAKSADPTREELMRKYESDYADAADKMTNQLLKYATAHK